MTRHPADLGRRAEHARAVRRKAFAWIVRSRQLRLARILAHDHNRRPRRIPPHRLLGRVVREQERRSLPAAPNKNFFPTRYGDYHFDEISSAFTFDLTNSGMNA
jgi:hypothetical protein